MENVNLPHSARLGSGKFIGQNRSVPSRPVRIALVGERDDAVTAHRAIPLALRLAPGAPEGVWVRTDRIAADGDPGGFDGIWVVPASPYADAGGALRAIRFARERGVPFLGTCGGFQHALIEFARHLLGRGGAEHAETAPEAADRVIVPLACSLGGGAGETVRLRPGSRLAGIYGSTSASENYNCNYGFDDAQRPAFEAAGLVFSAENEAGALRAFEIPAHPFFFGTLYQVERAALAGRAHPLTGAFAAEAAGFRDRS
jgi:CTP synthase (UTP-ammonia lyase)